ncbi:hypothetical protein Poli38472_013667 [Pythium oligandrum]|uniref:C1q domain-containing protein n=1 Tax=Pythium oligandrum TaxID=41045 RepID=A0A8K1CDS5_PYTOL|nr:hypothetical protein Poli38472_013667 [Pythium oligandrum]|eukprot:TMW61204.1 hypothetical protein Poli38472_013667 [Pythium oligandrum]
MASTLDMQSTGSSGRPGESSKEGVVKFPRRAETYRFRVSSREERLQFWLEDCASKQQWESSKLSMEDFTTPETMIPQAGFADYVSCFQNCIDTKELNESAEFYRELVPHESDDWELRLTLKIKIFVSVWTLKYAFILKQISLEPIDVLTAKVRDQADYIKALEKQIKELKVVVDKPLPPPPSPMYAQAKTTTQHHGGQTLVWARETPESVGRAFAFMGNGGIRIKAPGVYTIHLVIQHNSGVNGVTVEVQVNEKIAASTIDSNPHGHISAAPLQRVLSLTDGDEVKVVYRGNNSANSDSSLLIYQLR